MPLHEALDARFGPPQGIQPVPADRRVGDAVALPAELATLWETVGWCSYGHGALWVVDPSQFADLLDGWGDFSATRSAVFMRTSFAHLYVWHDGHAYSVDVHRGSISRVTKNIEVMIELVCDPEVGEKILRLPLHQQAVETLGVLEWDECYAFEPALALGGSADIETVRRVKIREQLGLLAQLVER